PGGVDRPAPVDQADSVPVRALARPPPAHALSRRRAARRGRLARAAAGHALAWPLSGTSDLLVARAALPDRRRRNRNLAEPLRGLAGLQPQPRPAQGDARAARLLRSADRRRRSRRSADRERGGARPAAGRGILRSAQAERSVSAIRFA